MKLYEIPTEQQEALAAYHQNLAETGEALEAGEITADEALAQDETAAEELALALDRLDGAFDAKAESVAKMIRNLEAERDTNAAKAKPFEEEVARYKGRARSADSSVRWLKDYLKHQMERMGLSKVEGVDLKIGVQNNGRPSVVVENLDKVPAEYLIQQEPKLASNDAVAAWKSNGKNPDAVPGLRFDLGQHVRIR